MTVSPALDKNRIFYSRLFVAGVVFLVMVSRPSLPFRSPLYQCMLWVGLGLVVAGAMGRVYCALFISGRKSTELVQVGPFSVVRNPLYVFSFLALLGCGLQTGMFTIVALLVAGFALYYPQVVEKEEAKLRAIFGAEYDTYSQRVPRWKPKRELWNLPDAVTVNPRLMYKAMRDASWFFVPLPVLMLLMMLRNMKVLSVLWKLP
ncbi:MAG: isoprenylcysteine carboxylmethyltransferase family protein [Rickettsiales bacterium]|nr:isoprenylcysteine carboxylmethyltransferase family protein [Rickettsiales bacterium]